MKFSQKTLPALKTLRFTYIGQNSADFCTRLQKIQKESAICLIGGRKYIALFVKMTAVDIMIISWG